LKKGDCVVFESTVYPGCTEEDCIPILEQVSGLKYNEDFFVGYSPERINPGDKVHTLQNVVKVVSGSTPEALEAVAQVYEMVVDAGVHRAPTIKVAEAAKIIENTQRDVNIALINELSIIFNKLNINTYDVLEAAGTKWNFLKFSPGLVGGHCIGVDPYYLTHRAQQAGYHSKVITSGRYVNDSMGFYIAKQAVKRVIAQGKIIQEARALIMGTTFKEDVSDIRNSKVIDIVNELKSFQMSVDLVDPHASSEEMMHEYGVGLIEQPGTQYDAIIVAVNHREYADLDEPYFKGLLKDGQGVFIDVKGIYKGKINSLVYWSL
jgi:UDP-N-acetyl-D-galactosamine dehydrogenase